MAMGGCGRARRGPAGQDAGPAEAAPRAGVRAARATGEASGGVAEAGLACLDLRELPAPEPFERGLAAADALAPGAGIVLLTPRLPGPLLGLLQERGFATRARVQSDGSARVVVQRPVA